MKKKMSEPLYTHQKTPPLYAGLGSKQQNFSNCQTTYQKKLCLLFKKSGHIFHRANVKIGFTPPPHVRFRLLFKDHPSPYQGTCFFNAPIC